MVNSMDCNFCPGLANQNYISKRIIYCQSKPKKEHKTLIKACLQWQRLCPENWSGLNDICFWSCAATVDMCNVNARPQTLLLPRCYFRRLFPLRTSNFVDGADEKNILFVLTRNIHHLQSALLGGYCHRSSGFCGGVQSNGNSSKRSESISSHKTKARRTWNGTLLTEKEIKSTW